MQSQTPTTTTLLSLHKLLTHRGYREQALRHVSDPTVQSFFDLYDNHWNDRFREEATSPILNKVDKFVTNPLLRTVMGQPLSSFDFRWLMDNKKILLCDLSQGALGADASSLLGSLVVTKLSLAALSREAMPEDQRQTHIMYVDEAHSFIHGVDFPTVLSEARKYRLSLVVASQTIQQLPDDSVAAVFGNCATVMSFRVSGEDAETLRREFAMLLPASSLQDLPDYKLYLRTLSNGRPIGPYLVNAFPAITGNGKENDPKKIIRASLQRFGQPRAEVEARIRKFLSQ